MSENIKPCPRCGAEVKIAASEGRTPHQGERPVYIAYCTNQPACQFSVDFLDGDRYRRSAISDYHKYLKSRKAQR